MDNDTTMPIGYYAELANDYGSFKGRIVAHDDKWIVLDPIPGPDPNRRNGEELVGRRLWIPTSRTYLITVAPQPPQAPQPQAREAEAQPAREGLMQNWTERIDRAIGDYAVTYTAYPNPRAG